MREVKLCSGKIYTFSDDKSDKIVKTMYSLYLTFNGIRYILILKGGKFETLLRAISYPWYRCFERFKHGVYRLGIK